MTAEQAIQFSIQSHAHRLNADLRYASDLALEAKGSDSAKSRQLLMEVGNICQRVIKELYQDVLR